MVDYSKWKNIEISDDEDETHPNIDTPSLFRWRHQARVEKMEARQKEFEKLLADKKEVDDKIKILEKSVKENPDNDTFKKELSKFEKKREDLKKREEDWHKEEKKLPWNVDTISQQGFSKTVVNKKTPRAKDENLSEEEREQRMKKFIKENEKQLKHFGMLRRYDDSKKYLKENPHLVCEDTANYLVIWCINLEMEEKHELMAHVAHQTICMQYILELAKQLDYDPRACLDAFFSKIQVAEPEYKASFDDELKQFKERIKRRAQEKLEDAVKKMEEEERLARLGPGGLDPVEVFDTLPEELKKCFESQNIEMLQETIAKMNEEDARYHMKRCVDSGLWVPDAKSKENDSESGEGTSKSNEEKSNDQPNDS